MRCMAAAFVSIVLGVSLVLQAKGRQIWDYRNGSWSEATMAPSTQPIDDPDLDHAEQLLFHGDFRTARKVLLAWEKANKKAPDRDRCIYLLAEAFFQSDDRIKSFYYCDELMDEYPESPLFQAALQRQFQIADAFLHGYKRVLLFFRILDETDTGIQMMFRIQQRAPGSPLAEQALLHTADYYFEDGDYDLAFDAYNAYARSYPRSVQIARVKLRAAYSSLAQYRGVRFDATNIIDARAQLLDMEKNYPELAADENIANVIERIDSAFAEKLLLTAEFYQRTHEPRGAVYEYRFLVQTYPNSPEAATARERLADIHATLLNEPAPPPANGYAPSTQPSANAQ